MDWKTQITHMISDYIREYENSGTPMRWKAPLVGFAAADSPEFPKLSRVVHPEHALPRDILSDASIVVSYFLPYPDEIVRSNLEEDRNVSVNGLSLSAASAEWAMAYRETNILFGKLNDYLKEELEKLDQQGRPVAESGRSPVRAALPLKAASMDSATVTSRWSQRHVARIAGLGTFGMNNMLITDSGCCGRYSSLVTDLKAPADPIRRDESCLYKRSMAADHKPSCGLCIGRCPSGALTAEGFDRFLCSKVCEANQEIHDPGVTLGADSEVCGKCLSGLPCSFCRP